MKSCKECFLQYAPPLLKYLMGRLNLQDPPSKVILKTSKENADNVLGKTGYYDPLSKSIILYITNRHPKDVLRSFAHELIHYFQDVNNTLDITGYSGEGYAQKNVNLRNAEKQAFLLGNMFFRDWEDSVKSSEIYKKSHAL